MKILFIHNKYGVTSGEEVMVQRIVDLLQNKGHQVHYYFKNSADISPGFGGRVRSFFSGIYSFKSRQEIRKLLKDFKPDLVQIQNLFPLISPSILPEIKAHGIPIVMRLANYRLVCPNGLFLSRGSVCEKCRSGREYWCMLRNCEGNFYKSLGYALRNWLARTMRFYQNNVTLYYAQTVFQKKCLVDEGFADDRINVIPNMVEGNTVKNESLLGDYIAYAGRISPEKGAATLVEAATKCSHIPFKLAGEHERLPDLVSGATDNVEFLGHLNKEALDKVYKNCRIFVMPSICYEGFPGVLIEAMLHGKPVICSRIGGLPEIVDEGETGLLFEPGNPNDMADKIRYLWERPELCQEMGTAGREKVRREYSPAKYYRSLMKVYKLATELNNEKMLSRR